MDGERIRTMKRSVRNRKWILSPKSLPSSLFPVYLSRRDPIAQISIAPAGDSIVLATLQVGQWIRKMTYKAGYYFGINS